MVLRSENKETKHLVANNFFSLRNKFFFFKTPFDLGCPSLVFFQKLLVFD